MTNAELIKALRYCADEDKICTKQTNCGYYGKDFFCQDVLMHDAADALEAAEQRIDNLQQTCDKLASNLQQAQLPKEGEWIDEQRGRWIYAKCNLCGKVQDVRSNYCPDCGAKMNMKKGKQE